MVNRAVCIGALLGFESVAHLFCIVLPDHQRALVVTLARNRLRLDYDFLHSGGVDLHFVGKLAGDYLLPPRIIPFQCHAFLCLGVEVKWLLFGPSNFSLDYHHLPAVGSHEILSIAVDDLKRFALWIVTYEHPCEGDEIAVVFRLTPLGDGGFAGRGGCRLAGVAYGGWESGSCPLPEVLERGLVVDDAEGSVARHGNFYQSWMPRRNPMLRMDGIAKRFPVVEPCERLRLVSYLYTILLEKLFNGGDVWSVFGVLVILFRDFAIPRTACPSLRCFFNRLVERGQEVFFLGFEFLRRGGLGFNLRFSRFCLGGGGCDGFDNLGRWRCLRRRFQCRKQFVVGHLDVFCLRLS